MYQYTSHNTQQQCVVTQVNYNYNRSKEMIIETVDKTHIYTHSILWLDSDRKGNET